jgi:signal transduction histidine kinase
MLADMVAEQYPDDEDIQEMTEMVIEARRRILDLVDEIRMFARGDTRSYNMLPQPISDVTERVVRFVRCDAKVRRTELKFDIEDRSLVIMDADRIRQVLINLIQNAADAVHSVKKAKISVRVYTDDEFACVSVHDNGTGISPEIRARIFDPLFTTKGENGLGLGLDICRRIIEAHHGSLMCESEPRKGTQFVVCLPLNPDFSLHSLPG